MRMSCLSTLVWRGNSCARRTSIMTHVTLPNLRTFVFQAVIVYSEAVFSRITAVPPLLQFMGRTENPH